MMHKIFLTLVDVAKNRMKTSNDPTHDHEHAQRVAYYAEQLGGELHISDDYVRSLVLAAWWHDVARTVTTKPSFIWMPFVDDLLSALMLFWHALFSGLLSHTSLAVRLIACKSVGTGAILTRILIKKRDRVLIDLLHDADRLDVFSIERYTKALALTESSRVYSAGYRVMCRWFSLMRHIRMKTEVAQKYFMNLLKKFIAWFRQQSVYGWHVEQFGSSWANKTLRRWERIIHRLTMEVSSVRV